VLLEHHRLISAGVSFVAAPGSERPGIESEITVTTEF